MKKTLFSTVFVLAFCHFSLAQTKVTVHKTDGTQQEFLITWQGSLSFEENNLLLFEGGIIYSPTAIPRSEIRKLTFTEMSTDVVETDNYLSLQPQIFPNPAQNFIQISGVENAPYDIVSLDGKLLQTGIYSVGKTLDISALQKGFYLIKIKSSTLKFVKL